MDFPETSLRIIEVMAKYLNKKTEIDGIVFDSKKEAEYYLYLKQLQETGVISNLQLQVPFEIIPAVYGERTVKLKTKTKTVPYCIQRATHYVADFVYIITDTGERVVVDVKSKITRQNAEYRLKKKMMQAFNNITIKEV